MELPSKVILLMSVQDPNASELPFADTLRQAMEAPAIGPPRRPQRVRVADAGLAEEITSAFPDMKVDKAPTPELDQVLRQFAESTQGQGTVKPSYFEGGRVSEEVVEDLFQAARILHTVAPWKSAGDGLPIRLDIPSLDVNGACISIIGALGESLGILIFPSLKKYGVFLNAAKVPHRKGTPFDLGTSFLSLNFERGADLPEQMRREAMEYGWEVSGPDAYPRVEHRDRDAHPRPLTERDVRIASTCARSLATFFIKNGEAIGKEEFESICESFIDEADTEVRFTVPYEAGPLFDVNQPPEPDPES